MDEKGSTTLSKTKSAGNQRRGVESPWDSVASYILHMSSITQCWLASAPTGASTFNHSTLMGRQRARLQSTFTGSSLHREEQEGGRSQRQRKTWKRARDRKTEQSRERFDSAETDNRDLCSFVLLLCMTHLYLMHWFFSPILLFMVTFCVNLLFLFIC